MDLISDLNTEQKKAVTHGNGPLLIVAGAGTGKTTVITRRIAWLIEEKLAATHEILAITFSEKAAREMEERVDILLPYGYTDVWISTFHAFCERILKEYGLDIGIPNNFTLLDEANQWILFRKNLSRFSLNYYQPRGNPTKFIHAMIKHFSRCKDETITQEEYMNYAEKLHLDSDNVCTKEKDSGTHASTERTLEIQRIFEIASAFHAYQKLLLDENALDFADLITYTLELFRKRPNILQIVQNRFKYILVDEFQDTNLAQYEIIKLLAGTQGNLAVVGDDDQSIYKFRGASISNILNFIDDFPTATKVFLKQNYRSCQNILDLTYAFILQNNPDRLEVKLNMTGMDKKLISRLGHPGIIEHLHASDVYEEVEMVVKKIQEIYESSKDTTWNDFAILVRANESAKLFMDGLDASGIPNLFLANHGFYQKPVVLDTIHFLSSLVNPYDHRSIYRLLCLTFLKIGEEEIIKINQYAHQKSLSFYSVIQNHIQEINIQEKTREQIRFLLHLIEKGQALLRNKNIREILLFFFTDSGYFKWINSLPENISKEYMRSINQFDNFVKKYLKTLPSNHLEEFLEHYNSILESGDAGQITTDDEEGPDMVKIMTIHLSKGLEFKYVFLVNLVDKRFPSTDRKDAIPIPEDLVKEKPPEGDSHIQEERRIFYVACTRAKERLFFTSADDYGGARTKKLSRFLNECGFQKPRETKQKNTRETVARREVPKDTLVIQKKERIDSFSFTQLKTFETCPLQYKFAHILRIPILGKSSLSFGKTMHTVLQKFFEKAKERVFSQQTNLFSSMSHEPYEPVNIRSFIPFDGLLEIYTSVWEDDWYENENQKKDYHKHGQKILKQFYDSLPELMILPDELEKPFHLKISPYTLRGKIDRIDRNEDTVEIIDYKTGTTKDASSFSKEDKMQLLIYQLAYEQIYGRRPTKLTYYYLDTLECVSFLGTQLELEEIKRTIIETIQNIQKGNFFAKPGFHCKFCDFYNICEYRKTTF
jgi:DNA helicase-2/ATP-dependent DNA helicase PcrA